MLVLWYAKCVLCSLFYRVQCTLPVKPKLAVFYVFMLINFIVQALYRNSNFVLVLKKPSKVGYFRKIAEIFTTAIGPKIEKVLD